MSVLKHVKELTSKEEFQDTYNEYVEETQVLREATDMINKSIAEEARRIMSELNISQNELCRRLKISSRTMDGIIHGRANPTVSTLVKLATLSGRKPELQWK